jgi:hypothetical protein
MAREVARQAAVLLASVALAPLAWAFCGFYVAQADTKIFNQSSKVVLARNGDQTTLTMSNDFKGDVREFAVVIPVPTVLKEQDITIADTRLVDHLDAYTAPRLVEYWDPDPCMVYEEESVKTTSASGAKRSTAKPTATKAKADHGVTIEATYDVGEYDILILSAKDSSGLETWLVENEYRIPQGASDVLGSYIAQNMKFFVAKVDLDEHAKLEQPWLRPIKVTYESPKFMLPIRLGMVNADGPQELFVFALTSKGRVETTNYRNTKIPTDLEVPEFVKTEFGPFYKDMFSKQVDKHGMTTVFTEYAWPLTVVCDPCSAGQLTATELQGLGAGWATEYHGGVNGGFVTRMHVRYDLAHFPEDLVFQETADTSTFQGRYVMNHPFNGDTTCEAGREYEKTLAARQEKEVANLASLTGWSTSGIRSKIPKRANPYVAPAPKNPGNWWEEQ